jgi:glycosyltransferase involved in cell wall biosynthesis
MLENAARIAFTTNHEARKVMEYLQYKLEPFVVPNVVDASDFADLPPRGSFRDQHGIAATTQVLVHYGRIARVKGIEFAVKAVAALRRQGSDVVLLIVGGDDEGHKDQGTGSRSQRWVSEDALIFHWSARASGRPEGPHRCRCVRAAIVFREFRHGRGGSHAVSPARGRFQ